MSYRKSVKQRKLKKIISLNNTYKLPFESIQA